MTRKRWLLLLSFPFLVLFFVIAMSVELAQEFAVFFDQEWRDEETGH